MDEESASVTEEVSPTCHAAGADQVREDNDGDVEVSDADDYDLMTTEAPQIRLLGKNSKYNENRKVR